MELFWYRTRCTGCNKELEHTFTPEGVFYADKYNHFVSTVAPSRYTADYMWQRCNTCRGITKQEVIDYAPAYSGQV